MSAGGHDIEETGKPKGVSAIRNWPFPSPSTLMQQLRAHILSAHPQVGDTVFVAIDGHGGSGKSTLAMLLGDALGASVIHTDEFASVDTPLDWWPKVIEQVFRPIGDGATTITYQPTSWGNNHHPHPVVKPVTPIMILEGVSSSRSEFADHIGFRIFVDTPKATCLQRGVARDSAYGKSKKEIAEIWEGWFAEEDEYFQRDDPKTKSDLILDGTKPFETQILNV